MIREDACALLQACVESLNIPVVSTLASKGVVPESHPLFISPGNKYIDKVYREKLVAKIFENCDLLLLIGYDYGEDLKPSLWEKNIPTVVINSYYNDMGAVFQPTLLIEGDLKSSLNYIMAQAVERKQLPDSIRYVKQILDQRSVQSTDPNLTKIASVVAGVRQALGASGILCSDIGLHKQYAGLLSQTYEPNTFLCSNVCGTFGFGLPAAMGAQLAAPEKRVALICGDGGFHSTSQDLETLVRHKLPIVIVMLKDDAFGLIKYYQLLNRDNIYKPSVEFGSVDFVKLAEANGMKACHIDEVSCLVDIMENAFAKEEPLLIEIPIQYNYNILNGLMEHISLSKPLPEHA